jgi:hypothetical protein
MNISSVASGTDIFVNNVAKSIADISIASGARVGGQIIATTFSATGSPVTAAVLRTDRFLFSAICVGGTVTAVMSAVDTSGNIATAGATLTVAWTLDVATANFLKITAQPNSSLVIAPKIDWSMVINGMATIGQYGFNP